MSTTFQHAVVAALLVALSADAASRVRDLPLPPSAEPRLLAPADGGASGPLEPYLPLSGGAFTGPAIPFHADPLARYEWAAGVNESALQIISLLPASATLTPGTAEGAFANVSSLLAPRPYVTVSGAGGVQLDYGLELAAWIEFESPDLAPADVAAVTLSVSEYSEYEITNLGDKVGVPVVYAGAGGATMYRLELPHPDLYEGVRFAWLRVNSTPSAPWHVTTLRLVAQVKPTNWGGAFAAAGDDALSRIWYLGAYTVKANLLSDQIGSILIYRGDRYSWTGDAHVSQATASEWLWRVRAAPRRRATRRDATRRETLSSRRSGSLTGHAAQRPAVSCQLAARPAPHPPSEAGRADAPPPLSPPPDRRAARSGVSRQLRLCAAKPAVHARELQRHRELLPLLRAERRRLLRRDGRRGRHGVARAAR